MKIAHISDLHFGCLEAAVVEALLLSIDVEVPDLVIASGDITQSATVEEFEAARAFFQRLKPPVLVIPGNHDLPGLDPTRFINPFGRYRRYIAKDLNPEFRSDLVHIKGLNSARALLPHWNWANGSISAQQCRAVKTAFAGSKSPWRICVLHHPVMNSSEFPLDVTVFNRDKLLTTINEQRVDLILAGHQHHAFTEPWEEKGHTALFINASTATSSRIRRQPNGYNLLYFNETSVRIDMLRLNRDEFEIFEAVTHSKPVAA